MTINRPAVLEYVKSVQGSAFAWGKLDCTLFPARCFDVLTGADKSAPHINQWSDLATAVKYSKRYGLTLETWLIDNGCQVIPPNYQQTADFLMIDTVTVKGHTWLSAAVCLGMQSALCTENGVEIIPTHTLQPTVILGLR